MTTESFVLHYPGEKGNSSIRAPAGLKTKIDEFLGVILETTGASFTRNEFIIKAIKHYLNFCIEAKNRKDLVKKIENT